MGNQWCCSESIWVYLQAIVHISNLLLLHLYCWKPLPFVKAKSKWSMLFTNSAGRLQKFCLINHAVRLLPAIPRQISTHDGIPVRRGGKRSWLPNSAFCNLRCLLINLDSFQRRERPALVHLSPCESESECWPNCHFSAQFSVKTVTHFTLIHVSSAHCHTLKVKV